MIDQELIEKKIDSIEEKLNYLEKIGKMETEEFLNSYEKIQASKHTLQEAIEACLDIANHIIAARGLKRSETYSDMFQRLAENQILKDDLSDRLSDMARFRNLLVHQYTEIENQRVHEIIKENLSDIEEFLKSIVPLLESETS